MSRRTIALAALSLAALAPAAQAVTAPAVESAATSYVTPRSGSIYSGNTGVSTRKIDLQLGRRSIELVAFDFKCGGTVGRTSLNGIKLTKTARGWRFATRQFGGVTYRDEQGDDNGRFDISGRFSRTARSIRGTLRAKSPRCGTTRTFDWSARLQRR